MQSVKTMFLIERTMFQNEVKIHKENYESLYPVYINVVNYYFFYDTCFIVKYKIWVNLSKERDY